MSLSRKSTLRWTITTLLCLVTIALRSAASTYSAADDFSSSNNPNGAWSYGWSATLGSTFNLDTTSTNSYQATGLIGWLGNQEPGGYPFVLDNDTASTILFGSATAVQPGQLLEHPGDGYHAVVRWIAPFSGMYGISATFSGLSSAGDSVDVHILHNGTPIFNSAVFGSPSPTSYSAITNLVVGDTIDFVVGDGGNGKNEDATALSATIVPEAPLSTCPNLVGTWSGQMNVADARKGFSNTLLSMHVTDQTTNGCLIRGYLTTGNVNNNFSNLRFGWNPWFRVPFTGTIPDASTVLLNVGGDGSGKASAILDMGQTPPVLTKFIYQPNNGDTLTGDLTLQPSSP